MTGAAHREWSLPAAIDAVTDAVPDREMLVWTSVRRSYAEVRERTVRLAAVLRDAGLGVDRERTGLERWECGQSPIAVVLSNCPEYLETMATSRRCRGAAGPRPPRPGPGRGCTRLQRERCAGDQPSCPG